MGTKNKGKKEQKKASKKDMKALVEKSAKKGRFC